MIASHESLQKIHAEIGSLSSGAVKNGPSLAVSARSVDSRLQESAAYIFPQKAKVTAPTRNRNATPWFHLSFSPKYSHANTPNTTSVITS